MNWWKVAAAYFGITVAVVLVAFVVTETVELLVGRDERDVTRSGRWRQRVARLADGLRGGWTLGLAWTFAVFVMVELDFHDTPTAADRWELLKGVGFMFAAWVLVSIVWAGVNARHAERIDRAVKGPRAEE